MQANVLSHLRLHIFTGKTEKGLFLRKWLKPRRRPRRASTKCPESGKVRALTLCYPAGRASLSETTPVRRDGEDRTRLSEPMRAREAAAERGGAQARELTLCVPPLPQVHLAEAGDENAKLKKPVQVHLGVGHDGPRPLKPRRRKCFTQAKFALPADGTP
jgi:hypothetical protein